MYFWFRLLSHWPLWALHAVGHAMGWLVWLGSPRYRRRFLENIAQAQIPLCEAWGGIGQAGCMSSELPRLWLGSMPAVRWLGEDVVGAAYASGKGVIFLTPHLEEPSASQFRRIHRKRKQSQLPQKRLGLGRQASPKTS